MYIIPVRIETLDMIEAMNNGNRPEIQEVNPTFFIYDKDAAPEIIDHDEMLKRYSDTVMREARLLWKQ